MSIGGTPLVSIVVPCYNQAHFLAETLACVLQQTYANIETIVVNDGSTDETEAVAGQFADRVRYLARPNGGSAAARNTGLAVAHGRYVLFLDADDLLHPQSIQWMVEAAGGREDCLVIQGFKEFGEAPEGLQPPRLPRPEKVALGEWLQFNPCPPLAILCPKALIREVGGFDETIVSCEDWDLWLRILFRGTQTVLVPQIGAYYRRSPGTKTSKYRRWLHWRIEVLLRAHQRAMQRPDLRAQLAIPLLLSAHRAVRRYYALGVRDEQWPKLLQMIRELNAHGYRARWSWVRRMIDPWLNYRAEYLVATFDRLYRPARLRHLLQTIGSLQFISWLLQ